MDKIFRRSTQTNSSIKKKQDEHARKRNIIMNFRVSPEEKEAIDRRIELSGLSKSEFFINSCMHQHITVVGNIKTFDEMKKQLNEIRSMIENLPEDISLTPATIEALRMTAEILGNVYTDNHS